MIYICDLCGYEYNEADGAPEVGVAPGTKWAALDDSFVCPLCGAAKGQFTPSK